MLENIYIWPIKYYKLNSNNDKFQIKFDSSRNHKVPVNIPNDEEFCIEIQFMQNKKMFNI